MNEKQGPKMSLAESDKNHLKSNMDDYFSKIDSYVNEGLKSGE